MQNSTFETGLSYWQDKSKFKKNSFCFVLVKHRGKLSFVILLMLKSLVKTRLKQDDHIILGVKNNIIYASMSHICFHFANGQSLIYSSENHKHVEIQPGTVKKNLSL